jgi:type II pantothenate kinase
MAAGDSYFRPRFEAQEEWGPAAAIDFGASNTDAISLAGGHWHEWTHAQSGVPGVAVVRELLASAGFHPSDLTILAVTGGHHRSLPDEIDGCHVVKVGELEAIARGGQAQAAGGLDRPAHPLLVVSAGSGTAMVRAEGRAYRHVTGTGVGGGTLLGLGRLLLHSTDPADIDRWASKGTANAVDLGLHDVVSGPIGNLPPDATAVNFGRLARLSGPAQRDDLAAALVTMVGQVIATLAINAGRASQVEQIIVTGHLTDMATIRKVMGRVGEFFGFSVETNPHAGYATAIGALLTGLER